MTIFLILITSSYHPLLQAETAELRDILDELRADLAKKHNTKAKIIFTDVQLENLARAV